MSARSTSSSRRASSLVAILWGLSACAVRAETADALAEGMALQLEVYRNGEATGLVAAFRMRPDGQIAATS
ncbi:MAG: hypothetical protein U1C74_26785, partial [Phenylobacterium sp.]|nr:hypothetical protein [Phenylobacterium sp.]